MGETAYELLALGLRYVFVLLIGLMLLRAFFVMWGDRRAYAHTLRQLPDAGLVGEVVELSGKQSQPLPREGLIGSGRSCDVRIAGLHRREMEYAFRPGLGIRLFPLRARHHALLDEVPLGGADVYALHGTVLDVRGIQLRFRLFAGLDVPERVVYSHMQQEPIDHFAVPVLEQADMGELPILPPAQPPEPSMEMTWHYAPLPPDLFNPPAPEQTRRRRIDRRLNPDE